MFNVYEPPVKATIAFLRLLKTKVNNITVIDTLQNHPDWPSMLCISDSLIKWNIPNAAGKIDPNNIDELPTPFIGFTSDTDAPFVVVTQVSGSAVQLYQKSHNKQITITRETFLRKWHGIFLIAEKAKNSGELHYVLNRRKTIFKSLIPAAALAILIVLSFLLINKTVGAIESFQSVSTTGIYLQYFILLSGVIITSLLLWYEIDRNNPILQKVCTGIVKGNCNAILTSKQSKAFEWLSWSEVGFFYFTGGLLVLLFAGNNITNAISLLAWLNILALPYTVFSIYYQWRIAKQWCVLCLAVQALLIFGGINILINNFNTSVYKLPVSFFLNAVLIYLLPVLLWYTVKPHLLRLQEAKNTKREYLRIKLNAEIFETLLKKQKEINIPTNGLGIDIGNPDATNILIKVCNPYCGPCAKVHPKIDNLLEEIPNLKVKIIFTTPNKPDQRAFKPVSHLMAIADQNNNERIIKQSLDDWYLSEIKDYKKFAAKYPMNGELSKQGDKIEAMEKWCKATDITFTPTIFINGHQLPDAYSIEDLQYFLAD